MSDNPHEPVIEMASAVPGRERLTVHVTLPFGVRLTEAERNEVVEKTMRYLVWQVNETMGPRLAVSPRFGASHEVQSP